MILSRPTVSAPSAPTTPAPTPTIVTGESRLTDEDRAFLHTLAKMTRDEFESLSEDQRQSLLLKVSSVSARLPNIGYDEPLMGSGEVLLKGELQGPDAFHQASGKAGIVKMLSGDTVVRLEHFNVQNAPVLRVILSADPEGNPRSRSIELGVLKGNAGSQTFRLKPGVSLTGMQTLAIYFPPFDTIYAIADLR